MPGDARRRASTRDRAPPVANSLRGERAIFASRARPRRPGRCIWLRCPAGLRSPPCKSPKPGLPRRYRRRHRRRPRRNEARLAAPEVRVVPPAPPVPPVREAPPRLWHRAHQARQARQAPRARLARPRDPAVPLRLAGRQARAVRRGPGRRSAPADPQRPADRPDLLDPASPRNTRSTGPRRIVRRRQLVHACGCSEMWARVAGHSGNHSSGSAASILAILPMEGAHERTDSEVRKLSRHPLTRTSESKGHLNFMILVRSLVEFLRSARRQ